MKVLIDYSDGVYSMRQIENENEYPIECQKFMVEIDSDVWNAYIKYIDSGIPWHNLMKEVDNFLFETNK